MLPSFNRLIDNGSHYTRKAPAMSAQRGLNPVNQPPIKKKDQSFTGTIYNTSTSQLVNFTGVYTLNSVASARSGEPTLLAAL